MPIGQGEPAVQGASAEHVVSIVFHLCHHLERSRIATIVARIFLRTRLSDRFRERCHAPAGEPQRQLWADLAMLRLRAIGPAAHYPTVALGSLRRQFGTKPERFCPEQNRPFLTVKCDQWFLSQLTGGCADLTEFGWAPQISLAAAAGPTRRPESGPLSSKN